MKQILDNIKKFRELKNMTREEIADKIEMSVSGYSKIERGEVDLTVNKLHKIAEILELDISQIMNFDASQIFNVNNNKIANVDIKEQHNRYQDDVKEKYITLLENEIKRLNNFN
jgi:transcriptional regulator with XRE-family HTH domain